MGSSVSISGPPSTLKCLESKKPFRDISVKLPITAAYHAPHLPIPNSEDLLQCAGIQGDRPIRENVTLISTSSGDQYGSRSLHAVLGHIVRDILQNPIIWKESLRKVKHDLQNQSVRILGIGPTNLTKALFEQLVQMGIAVREAHQPAEKADYSAHEESNSIAVVGTAGRFPGGHNLDEFWETINKGRDMHTKVSIYLYDSEPRAHTGLVDPARSLQRRYALRCIWQSKKQHHHSLWLFSDPSWVFRY